MSSSDIAPPGLSLPLERPTAAGAGRRGWLRRVIAPVALGSLMLMAVTVAVGRPMVFTDTDDYFSQGKDVVRALDLWLAKGTPPVKADEVDDRLHDPGDEDEEPVHNQNGARSVYYGLFVYSLERLGTLWAVAAAQAGLAAGIVYSLWRVIAPGERTASYLRVMGALAVGSSLPIFTGFAMPDLFAGFAVVATVLWTLYPERLGRWGALAIWALLAAAMNFHGSNLLTCVALSVLALGWLKLRGAPWRRVGVRLGGVLLAAFFAAMAAKAYAVAIKLRTGDDLGRPPFLMARVLADGPGRAYLRRSCAAGVKWTLCAYRNDPLNDTDDILWSDDPATGIFNSADYHTRAKLEREERRFTLAAVASDPLGELRAMMANWGRQLISVSYSDALRDPGYYLSDDYWKTTTLKGLLLRARRCDPEVGGCILNLPGGFLAELDAAFALAALGCMAWTLARERRLTAEDMRARAALVLLVAAVAVNAAVCGMLSGPFDRYQARILWLVPCAALLLDVARRRRP